MKASFLCFRLEKPSVEDLQRDHIECIYLSPANWNPNSDHFSNNEDMLIDFEGRALENDLSARKVERSYLIEEMDAVDPISIVQQFQINAVQVGLEHLLDQEIDQIAEVSDTSVGLNPHIDTSSNTLEQIFSSNDIHIDAVAFNEAVADFEAEQVFKIAVGSGSINPRVTTIAKSPFVEGPRSIGATIQSKPKGVSPEELMKVWRIDRDAAERTLKCTTQLKKQDTAAGISRRFSTNNRKLRYRRIK